VVFLVVRNYLPYARCPELLDSDELESLSLYRFLADRYDAVATTGQRQVELTRLDEDAIAAHLHVEPNSYVLFNREITYDQNGKALEYYESWHHPDRTRLSIQLQRTY
jgi:GntR family transcriptional regulator